MKAEAVLLKGEMLDLEGLHKMVRMTIYIPTEEAKEIEARKFDLAKWCEFAFNVGAEGFFEE